ncbi:MAG: hypothetical protein ABR501_04090 [Pyrinomonadaceae bacterium]
MRTLKIAGLLFSLSLISADVLAIPQGGQSSLYRVQKLYIENMGTQPEAVRFGMLLEDKLLEKGFTVVDKPENADAILSGAVSVTPVGIYRGINDFGVTVQLKSQTGERLWSGNFAGRIIILNPVASIKFRDVIEYRATELARKLRNDREKSAKAAGVKIGG